MTASRSKLLQVPIRIRLHCPSTAAGQGRRHRRATSTSRHRARWAIETRAAATRLARQIATWRAIGKADRRKRRLVRSFNASPDLRA